MLDQDTLQSFCESFYGYGEADAPHWFVSMEEGGGTSEEEIATRIGTWVSRGRREIEDLNEYHHAININKWFSAHPPLQKTWYATVRMLLILGGHHPSTDLARHFQRDHLARHGGNNRLSPLFPLPSRSLDDWNYAAWVDGAAFGDRASYRSHLENVRVNHLAAGIIRARPRTVVFYGQSYGEYWRKIAAVDFQRNVDGIELAANTYTQFVICNHPATQGIANEYFDAIGRSLAADCN